MDTLFGEGPLKIVLFVIVVLGLLALAFWLVRRFGGGRLGSGAARGRQPRLAVIDQANVDGRRRLVLIRRDNIEHLLIIGGPSDVVVEQNIVRAATAPREGATARPPAADTLPRAVPLGEDSMWSPQPEPAPKAEPTPRVEPPPVRAEPRPQRPPMASEEPMLWPGERPSEPQAPAMPPQAASPPGAPPFARERKSRGADPLAELAEELARVPASPESAEQRRMPRLQPAPPSPEPALKSPGDQNLSEMAQRLEAALRRPRGDDTRSAAGGPKSEPASEPFAAASSSRSDTTLRRPFKSDDLRAPLSPPKPANEPTAPAADEASADPAPDARERGGDAKSAGGKSFYDSLEQEMASLLNRPSSKP
ncbi:MAG TPA: flagellar biosynthetic protein FliO [Xanthobacteraceae bacterium]|jgi:flagellar protein FliO/FliZ|nr:flagellar biosynthetic protein FliO [Xanthobacteraceae bacterium]